MMMGWTPAGLPRLGYIATVLLALSGPAGAQTQSSSQLDARKELAGLGITWSAENFRLAVFRKDYHAVELFLKSGIDPHADTFFNRLQGRSLLTVFAIPGSFDPTIGKLLMTHPAVINSADDCPATSLPGSFGDQFDIYANARNKPDLAAFLQFFCNKPEVIAKIDERIAEIKAARPANVKLLKGWQEAKSFLTGLPPEAQQSEIPKVTSFQLPASATASAPPAATSSDVAALDVAGVRLGMTPDEAIAALKQFEPRFVIKKLYLNDPKRGFNDQGSELPDTPASGPTTFYLSGLSALDEGPTKPEFFCRNGIYCSKIYHEDVENIGIWFSPVPGQERVIAVTRAKEFHKEPKPVATTIQAGMLSKYSSPTTYQHLQGYRAILGWQYDNKKQLMSGVAAKNKRALEVSGEFPNSVSAGDGITLSFSVDAQNGSSPVADIMHISLLDAGALYKSIEQSKTTYTALKAKADAAIIEKANKGASQTKF